MNDNFRQGMYALVVVVLAAWFVGWAGGHDAHRGDDLPPDVAAAVAELRDGQVGVGPAEPLKELKPGMSWEVTGAGDATYDGVYEEDGTYNGQPAYTNGSKWLYWNSFGFWALESSKTEPPSASQAYGGTGASLPATPWSVLAGIAPAPTVAEYVEPPTPPDPDDTTTKRTGWIGGPLSPTLFPCQTVKPARFVGTDTNEYVAFLGIGGASVVLYCIDTGTWLNLTAGWHLSLLDKRRLDAWRPHPCLLHAGDGETLWYVTMERGLSLGIYDLSAYPLTLDIGSLSYTVGSLFESGLELATDLAIDAENTAWFVTNDYKLYSWDLSGASATLVKDWSTGRTDHGAHAGARFWYSGTAGEFFRIHNPYYGNSPDYIHRVSASVYEWTGDTVQDLCFSYDHDIARGLTYATARDESYVTQHWRTWRFRDGNGDGWRGANLSNALDYVWVIRGTPMALAGVNATI